MKHPVGIILGGCGVTEGSDPYEVAFCAYHIERHGWAALFFAPPEASSTEKKNPAVWSAAQQLSRGELLALDAPPSENLTALVIPGGEGILGTLATTFHDGNEIDIEPNLKRLIRDLHRRKRPIAACGVAGALVVASLFHPESLSPTVAVGKDTRWIGLVETLGGVPVQVRSDEVVIDEKNRIVTTPGFAADEQLQMVERGIKNLIDSVGQWMPKGQPMVAL